jgi:hypothetical protein
MSKLKTEYGKLKFGTRGLGRPNNKGKQRKLTYFYTTEQWEKARQSPAFLAWAKKEKKQPVKKINIKIKPRPVMHLAKNVIDDKIPELWAKARKYAK